LDSSWKAILFSSGTRSRDVRQGTAIRIVTHEELTSGLEPQTCRLRIDPVLRMLLCDTDHA
jgi:hypothetical protein